MRSNMKRQMIRWIMPLALLVFLFAGAQAVYAEGEISFEEAEYTFEAGGYNYIWLSNGTADSSTWRSSNENVVVLAGMYSNGARVDAVGVGSSTISVSDEKGNTVSVQVTVNAPEWELADNSFEDVISNYSGEVDINSNSSNLDLTAVSSNEKVVTADVGYEAVYLHYEDAGTAVVTVSDKYGKSETINVTINPTPLTFEDVEQTTYSEYDGGSHFYFYPDYDGNKIVSVSSSNLNVLTVVVDTDNSIKATPIGAGTATITAKDQYGQTGSLTITITQKYIDEMKYLDLFQSAFDELSYGNTEAYFTSWSSDFKGVTITATIGGVNYTAVYNGYDGSYEYVIKNIPVLPPETPITYTIRKGEAVYSGTSEIMYGNLNYNSLLELSNDHYVYSGKAIYPSASVDYYFNGWEDSRYLKKGTEYTVSYINNLDVGTATVKATGVGNFKDSVSEKFTIAPKGTSITKVKKAKKGFTVKWKKQATKMSTTPVTGYQIRYSRKSGMSGAKTVTVNGYKTTSKKISKLKAKKKYYVQVRTYKTVDGKNYYSSWSSKKKVKTK